MFFVIYRTHGVADVFEEIRILASYSVVSCVASFREGFPTERD